MAYPYQSQAIPRQSDEEFASWLAGQGRDVLGFLDESGARANPAGHLPPANMKTVGSAVRSPAEAAAAAAPPRPVDPLTARLERHAAMTDDLGLAANQRSAAALDEVDQAYQRGAGNLSEASPAELRHALGFSWGKDVDVDPATGRPRSNSTISTWDPSQGRTSIAANEPQGGGGVSTLGEAPPFRNIQPWQVEDAGRAADVANAERSIDEPLWLQRAMAGLDVEKATGIEAGRADVQDMRTQRLLSLIDAPPDPGTQRQWTSDLAEFRSDPQYQRAAPAVRAQMEAALQARQQQRLRDQRRQDLGLATGRATTTFKGDGSDSLGTAR